MNRESKQVQNLATQNAILRADINRLNNMTQALHFEIKQLKKFVNYENESATMKTSPSLNVPLNNSIRPGAGLEQRRVKVIDN